MRETSNPSYVLALQIAADDSTDDTELVKGLLDQVVADNAVDESRILESQCKESNESNVGRQ